MKLDFCQAEFHGTQTLLPCSPEYVTSHSESGFSDAIDYIEGLETGRLSWIIWVGPNVITRVPTKRQS